MRYASKKEESRGILPVMNPLFNLREICKQSALLEDHLNNPRKRCPDCIRKHFLTIEAFYEEAVSLDKNFKYDEYLDGKAEMMRDLQGEWLDARDTKKYGKVCTDISQRLRRVRKDFAPLCFDLRKMASLNEMRAPSTCHHKWATLSQLEKEEREVERLVKPKPKKKPPRKDLKRSRVKVEDPDLQNLGGGAGGDRDLSMNHKRVAYMKKIAVRVALRKMAEEGEKKKDPTRDSIVEELKKDKNPRYESDAGNKVTFYTAYHADPDSREYQSAHSEVQKRVETERSYQEEKAKKEQEASKRKDNAIRIGLKGQFRDDPVNFINLLKNGSPEISSDVFLQVLAEMTLHEDFKDGASAGVGESNKIDTEEQDAKILELQDKIKIAENDPAQKEALEAQLKVAEMERKRVISEGAVGLLQERMEPLRKFIDDLDVDALFGGLEEKKKQAPTEEGQETPQKELTKEEKIDQAKDYLLGKTENGRKALEENPALKFFNGLYKTNLQSKSKDQEKEDEETLEEAKKIREDFTKRVMDSIPTSSALASKRAKEGLKKVLELIGSLPESDLEKLQDGFTASAKELTEVFTQKKDPAEMLKELAEKVDELWSRPLSDLDGEELGQALAAAAMEDAFVNNFDYGIEPDRNFVTTFKDSFGREIVEEREGVFGHQIKNLVTRLEGAGEAHSNRRKSAYDHYSQKLHELEGQRGAEAKKKRLMYESALEGTYVSMLLEGDENLPQGRTKVDPDFLEYARQIQTPEAYELVSDLSKENKELSSEQVRNRKRQFLDGLDDAEFSKAVGGDSGPFSDLLESLDPMYCPDIPMNGTSAGQKVPVEECPLPIPPQMRALLRKHITTVSMDQYSVAPDSERSGGFGKSRGGGRDKEDKKESLFKGWMKSNQKALAEALAKGDEEALAFLFAHMREANLKDLNLEELIEGYNENSAFVDDVEKYRIRKITDLLKKSKADPSKIRDVIKEIDDAINEQNRSPFKKFGHARRAKLTHSFPKRLVGKSKRFAVLQVAQKYLCDRSFIRGRLSSDPEGVSIMQRHATSYVDYQSRAQLFELGMRVYPFYGGKPDKSGVVVQIFPAIGMVDVQFPHGTARYPVEDLVLDTSGDYENLAKTPDSIPGGRGVVPVSSGPSAKKVASRYLNRNRRG